MYFSKLFILTGHRKSGTSVFHRLFDGHPGIYLYPVDISILYAYFPFFVEKYAGQTGKLKIRLFHVLSESLGRYQAILEKKYDFKISVFAKAVCDSLAEKDFEDKEAILTAVADNWIKNFYKSETPKPFLFKETSQSIFLHEFLAFDTQIKMISLIRDPRDNYAAVKAGVKNYYSKINENELESLASILNRARMDLFSAQLNQQNLGDNFLSLRFEDLILDTKDSMERVADFLDLTYADSLLEPTFMDEIYSGNSHEGRKFNGLSNKNIGRWPSRISDDEAQIIEYWLSDVMGFWGYDLNFSLMSSQKKFAEFYNWYNSRYFYRDSFAVKE